MARPRSTDERTGTRGVTWTRRTLAALLILVSANAVYGGIGLMVDGLGMPSDWLLSTPFDSWLLPGLALLITVALPQLVVAVVVITWHPRAAFAGLAAGAALVAWIVVQVLVLRRYFFLQPVIAGIGLVELALAWWWLREGAHPTRR